MWIEWCVRTRVQCDRESSRQRASWHRRLAAEKIGRAESRPAGGVRTRTWAARRAPRGTWASRVRAADLESRRRFRHGPSRETSWSIVATMKHETEAAGLACCSHALVVHLSRAQLVPLNSERKAIRLLVNVLLKFIVGLVNVLN